MRAAIKLMRSLCMQLGYRSGVVLVDMIVETSELIWANVGESIFKRSAAIRFNAVLSKTTYFSEFNEMFYRNSQPKDSFNY